MYAALVLCPYCTNVAWSEVDASLHLKFIWFYWSENTTDRISGLSFAVYIMTVRFFWRLEGGLFSAYTLWSETIHGFLSAPVQYLIRFESHLFRFNWSYMICTISYTRIFPVSIAWSHPILYTHLLCFRWSNPILYTYFLCFNWSYPILYTHLLCFNYSYPIFCTLICSVLISHILLFRLICSVSNCSCPTLCSIALFSFLQVISAWPSCNVIGWTYFLPHRKGNAVPPPPPSPTV